MNWALRMSLASTKVWSDWSMVENIHVVGATIRDNNNAYNHMLYITGGDGRTSFPINNVIIRDITCTQACNTLHMIYSSVALNMTNVEVINTGADFGVYITASYPVRMQYEIDDV